MDRDLQIKLLEESGKRQAERVAKWHSNHGVQAAARKDLEAVKQMRDGPKTKETAR
jgi:hypothetical protein